MKKKNWIKLIKTNIGIGYFMIVESLTGKYIMK